MARWEARYGLPGEGNDGRGDAGRSFGGGAEGSIPARPPVVRPEGTRFPAPPRPPQIPGRRHEMPKMEASTGGSDGPTPPSGGREYQPPSPTPPPSPGENPVPSTGAARPGESGAPFMGDVSRPNDSTTPLPDPRAGGADSEGRGDFVFGSRSEADNMDHTDPVAPDAQQELDAPRPFSKPGEIDSTRDYSSPSDATNETGRESGEYRGPDFSKGSENGGDNGEGNMAESGNLFTRAARGVADRYVEHTWPLPEDEFNAAVGHRNAVRATANQPRYIPTRTKVLAGAPVAFVGEQIAVGNIPPEATGWGLIAAGTVAAVARVQGRRHFKAGAILASSGGVLEGMAATGEPRLAGAAVAVMGGAVAARGVYEGVTRAVRWQRSEGVVSRELRRQARLRTSTTNHTRGLAETEARLKRVNNPLMKSWLEMRHGQHSRALARRQNATNE